MKPLQTSLLLGLGMWLMADLEAAIVSSSLYDNANGDYPTLVRNDGALLDAVNLGHTGPDLVINGVAFASKPGITPSGANWTATGATTSDGLDNPGIDDVFFSELSAIGGTTLNYRNLNPNLTYAVQILHGEPRACCATVYANNTFGTDADRAAKVPPITLGNGVNGEDPPATSDLAILTIVITGATEFTYTARSGTGRDSAISGFQVRAISSLPPAPTGDAPFISEFVAVGNDTLQDEDGDTPDWLEIYNPTGAGLYLTGYHLTDDTNNLTKWTFPGTFLHPGQYLVVFASDKNRAAAGSELHTNFKLASGGNYLALVAPDGTNVISQFAPAYPAQAAGFSYGVGGLAPNGPTGYFGTPSPGSANGLLLTAPLIGPVVSPDRGTFTTSLVVTITTDFPGGQIRYTTNGSEPTTNSTLYAGPITISATTHLRARVFDPVTGGFGEITAAHFQKLSATTSGGLPAPAAFASDLPIVVVENFGAGGIPAPGATFQTARLSVHEVDSTTGRSSLANPPDACFRIGIRRRGQSSSGFAKPQYRVELRDENDVDLDYALLGLPEESDWVFNGPFTDKALIRNPLAFELGRRIGIEAPRSKHFEMFLSTDGGDLAATEYVGVYVLLESIKEGRNRTDLVDMTTEDNAEPEVTGGYMLRFEPPGIASEGPRAANWTSVEIIEPNLPTAAQRLWISDYLDRFVATLGWSRGSGPNNAGVPNDNPDTGYPAFIDVDSFVSLLIVNELLREQDSYVRSDYMFKDRLGKLHKGPLWDYNLIAGTGCCFDNRNPQGWQYEQNYNRGGRDHSYEPDWIVPLLRSPDFKQQFTDRWAALRAAGVLEVSNLFAVIDGLANPLAEAAVRNFTKWNNLGSANVGFPTPVTATWEEQIDVMKSWLVQRMSWIDRQFPTSVSFSPGSAVVAAGSQITLNTVGGTIYYTLDGTDPRLPGGGISPAALTIGGGGGPSTTKLVSETMNNVAALRPTSDSPGATAWTAIDYDPAGWQNGANGVGYENSAADYASLIRIDVGNTAGAQPHSVYVRYPFVVTNRSAINALTLHVKYDDGFIAYLNGTRIASANAPVGTPNWNQAATGDHPDSSAVLYEEFDVSAYLGALVVGNNLLAVHVLNNGGTANASNTGCTSSDLLLLAELIGSDISSGGGQVRIDSSVDIVARTFDGSGWSAPSSAIYVVGTAANLSNLVVTELNYHPADPTPAEVAADPTFRNDDFEFLELKNVGPVPIDLSGLRFVEGIAYTVPAPAVIPPGGYALLVENRAAFETRYGPGLPVLGVYANKMKNDGDTLRLVGIDGNDIFYFTFNDIWYRPTDGGGYTLVAADENSLPGDYSNPASWGISSQFLGNPGAGNGRVLSQEFEGWKNYHFSAAERADPLVSGPSADFDSDGINTVLEFALGLDPRLADRSGAPSGSIVSVGEDKFLALTFRRQQKPIGAIYHVETSFDLITWTGTTALAAAPIDNGDGTETVTIRDATPVSAASRFIRLLILKP